MMPNLPRDLERFIEQELSSGRFPNRDALLIHAVWLLRRHCDDATRFAAGGGDKVSDGAQMRIRRHDAFLNGYAPSDEGLYDDICLKRISS
jgi:Arc/MetJ-type ribon-helix-helix transcriptional regulator